MSPGNLMAFNHLDEEGGTKRGGGDKQGKIDSANTLNR